MASRTLLKTSRRGAWEQLARAIGVTRVARVTGLDRAAVEVACAVRPEGHVLQVSNGKGPTWEHARASALFEAAELWAAEHSGSAALTWACATELRQSGNAVWTPEDLGEEPGPLWTDETRLAWLPARRLDGKGDVWVPAQAVYSPPDEAPGLGPSVMRWTSNGMGAGFSRQRALTHALCEVMEREALCRMLPEAWTAAALRRFDTPPSIPLVVSLWKAGFDVRVFNLTPPGWAWPVFAALAQEHEASTLGVTAGYACRPNAKRAEEAAVLEAAQSRLTDIHGAREDVVGSSSVQLERVVPERGAASLARTLRRHRADMATALAALRRPAAFVELGSPGLGVHVVKAWVQGFRVSELLA